MHPALYTVRSRKRELQVAVVLQQRPAAMVVLQAQCPAATVLQHRRSCAPVRMNFESGSTNYICKIRFVMDP